MTVAVSRAIDRGARALICASTGNTSASAAAYAARAGIQCAVVLPAGKIATGKLVQAIAHGAKIVPVDGNFDDALRIVRELGEEKKFAIVNSINPDRIAGQKTAAFEIIDDLGDAPDFHLLPVGQCGKHHGLLDRLSRISRTQEIEETSGDDWVSGLRRSADRSRSSRGKSGNDRVGDPDR